MNIIVSYELSESQAVAILAALKLLQPEQVERLLPETKSELSLAYHRLSGALSRSLNAAKDRTMTL